MNRNTAHNLEVINRRLGVGNGPPIMTAAIYDGLCSVADMLMSYVDDDALYPVDTGNLRESTAVAIYVDGKVTVFRSQRDLVMDRPQEWNENLYWGRDQLKLALQFGATKYAKGVWIVLYASQPYAAWLNEEHEAHIGFFNEYADEMSDLVKSIVAARANAILKGNFKPKSAGKAQHLTK